MTNKTIYENFKEFSAFYNFLKPRFVADFRPKDKINNMFFSRGIYEAHKHDTYYGETDEALNRISTQITFDCAEFTKKEAIHGKIYEKVEKLLNYTTRTETKNQKEQQQKTNFPKTVTTQNEPLITLTDLSQGSFGGHNRADWLKTTQKQIGADTITTTSKEGMKVVDKEGKVKTVPNWVEVETQDNAGIARILACFQYIEIDLSKYLVRYKKFFYRSYGLGGLVYQDPKTKRHIFKSYEEIEEEELPEEEKKKKAIPTEDPELSFAEWKKKFKEEHPDQTPNFQLYTVYRLEKRKAELEKELKKTSGVFKDKLILRLTFTESLIEGFQKEIKMPPAGTATEKLPLGASDEERAEATFWARINQVVGYTEFKEIFADFVDGYNDLVEEGLQDKIPAQMFLLLGPPGVGKSFIAEMMAEATGRPIEVISMNGKKDTSVFFGVPQEWAGAGVGEILKTMVKHKDRAPIILLDEFEKCDKQVQQVLGNLTDKTLNKKFKDVFFDFPIPINQIIFFCTANYPNQIEPFVFSRLTPVKIQPATYQERLLIAEDLINYNFYSYKVGNLVGKFSLELVKKCLTKEWGVRGLKDNIERIAYKVFLLKRRGNLPSDWDSYKWPIVEKEEVDGNCPYSRDRSKLHKELCECFKSNLIPGWVDNMEP